MMNNKDHITPVEMNIGKAGGVFKRLQRGAPFLFAVAAGGWLLGAGRDAWANRVWKPDETAVTTLAESRSWLESSDSLPAEGWVAFGGLGRKSAEDHAQLLSKNALTTGSKPALIAHVTYPNQGINKQEIADQLAAFGQQTGGISIYGHSAGSIVALEALRRMPVKKPVKRFVLNGSPSSAADVVRREALHIAASLGRGDPLDKIIHTLLADRPTSDKKGRLARAWDIFKKTIRTATDGVAPKLYLSHLRDIRGAKFWKNPAAYQSIITPETEVLCVVSPDDNVVLADQAAERYRQFFTHPSLDAKFRILRLPHGSGHANTQAASIAMRDWVERTAPAGA